ncbi:hypothetical protein [Streptomyces hiroshimensis]|uniref:hypothetical protein n=1 Tax=Streptomyces hiroshimensis TaxID=66424 RepID=UPI0016747FB7|nr:hypothetical protein [Streptomyces hiroshimensis]
MFKRYGFPAVVAALLVLAPVGAASAAEPSAVGGGSIETPLGIENLVFDKGIPLNVKDAFAAGIGNQLDHVVPGVGQYVDGPGSLL